MPRWPAKKEPEQAAPEPCSEPQAPSDPETETEPKTVDEAGEGSLSKIPAKQRKFAKGQ